MFELSGVRVIEWFLWESISEGSTGIQKQLELLKVRVIGGSSYRECTVAEKYVPVEEWNVSTGSSWVFSEKIKESGFH